MTIGFKRSAGCYIQKMLRKIRQLGWLGGFIVAVVLSGCASSKMPAVLDFGGVGSSVNAQGKREIKEVMWPSISSGEQPRYQYAGELYGEENFLLPYGAKKTIGQSITSAFRWLVGLVVGEAEPVTLQRPQSGVVDLVGQRILITDTNRQAVYVFDQTKGRLDLWENATQGSRFLSPAGIVLGAASDVYVADAELAYVTRLDAQGKSMGIIGEGELKRPIGLAFDSGTQQLFVADTYAHDIKVFDVAGNLMRTLGRRGVEPGEFNFPTYLALAQGELYVTDTMNSRVQVLDAVTGESKRIIGERGIHVGNLVRPKGVAVDSEGNVYVVESYHDYLLVYNRNGDLLIPIGGTGEGIGQFYLPTSIWIDANDRIFVADMFNGRVALFQFLPERQVPASPTSLPIGVSK